MTKGDTSNIKTQKCMRELCWLLDENRICNSDFPSLIVMSERYHSNVSYY